MYMSATLLHLPVINSSKLSTKVNVSRKHVVRKAPMCVNQINSSGSDGVLKKSTIVRRTRMEIAEVLNSRMAMLGYVCGSTIEATTHQTYIEQIQHTYPFVIMMGLALGYATFKTKDIETEETVPFTKNIELLNGRMVMMGILFKFAYELSQMLAV